MQIIGSKKGQGTQRQPVITLDSAQSKTFINMLYGLGEGEICGLADGYKSVYLDDTPLQNANGEFNFANIKVDFRSGTNDQDYIEGFPDVASETAVNVELKHSIPFVKAFNNLDLDAIRIRLKWGALRSQNAESGDVSGVKIDYAIDLKTDNGGWVEVLTPSINAKTSDAYERSHRIDLPPAISGWQVRVRRLTPNSTSDLVSDKMYVSAITEVIDLKLRYPNTALLGLRYDAESFSNVAKMSARCKGLIIKVPTNYNPETRTYTGFWDGTFKQAYTNNPAWVYYDLCTNTRYGLGNRLTQSMIDKWSLYRLAQYCDELVDDGMGGQEPRFTVNVYIQSSEGAFELLSKLAGVFRAISYWDGNSIVVDADIPQDSIYSFSRANVINGVFEYTGTRARDRHTVAKVAWDNPNNNFKTEYEFVRDEKAIAKFGVRIADISAWGCTSRGQAQRAGLWALKSEQLETRMVTFKVGLDGYIPAPAKVIEISDELFAGRATGGRVLAINADKTIITLDCSVIAKAGDRLVINGDDGTSQRRIITSINDNKVTVTQPFDGISVENVWVLDSADLATMKFRVLSVTADDNHTFTITAVQYNPDKYDAIDTGAYIDDVPISVINPTVQVPTKSVNLSSYYTINQGVSVTTLVISWEQASGAVKYAVEWRKDNGNWQVLPPTGTNSIEIAGVYAGQYEARVTAISAFGQASTATHSALTQIHSKIGKPPRPTRLSVWGKLFAMDLAWTFANKSDDTNFTEIQVSPNGSTNIVTLGTFAYPTNKHEITGLQGNLTQYYRARIVDKLGNTSDWTNWVSGTTDARADKVLDIISGQIRESHLDQTLRTPIAKIGTLESVVNAVNGQLPTLNSQIATLNGKATSLQNELNTAKSNLQMAVSNITTERNRITLAIRDITALQSANTAKTQEIANLVQTVGGHTSSIRELGVTTGDFAQKYAQIKTQADNATSEISAIKQTQAGQATTIEQMNSKFGWQTLTTATNLNTLTTQGNYFITGARTNSPVSGWTYVTIDVPRSDRITQTAWADNAPNTTYRRTRSGTTWTAWEKMATGAELNTKASLADVQTLRQTVTDNNLALGRRIDLIDTAYKQADTQTNAKIESETTARTNADTALSQHLDTLQADYNSNKSSIANQLKTLTDKDTATASQISNLSANVTTAQNTANTANTNSQNAKRVADDALDKANTANSAITTEQRARADADTALGQRITAIDTTYKQADSNLTARLAREETARTNGDNANTQALRTLESTVKGIGGRVGTSEGKIATLERTTADTNQALSTAQSQLNARFDNLKIGGRNLLLNSKEQKIIGKNQQNQSLSDTWILPLVKQPISELIKELANTDCILSFEWEAEPVNGQISGKFLPELNSPPYGLFGWERQITVSQTNKKGFFSAKSHLRNFVNSHSTHVKVRLDDFIGTLIIRNAKLEIGNIATAWMPAYEDGDSWQIINQATDLNTLTFAGKYFIKSTNNQNAPVINWLFVQVDNAFDGRIMQKVWQDNNVKNNWIRHRLDGNWGTWEKLVNASELNSVQASINEFKQTQATKDSATAQSIQTMQTTLNGHTASIQQHTQSINGLSAQWTLKVEAGNRVAGIGLANSNGVSDFAVRADKFYIAPPHGSKGDTPFTVLTSPQVINGVQVPAGTYIKSTYIHKASIDTLHIRGNAITVPVSAFTADVITVDSNYTTIQNLYVPAGMGHTMLTFNAIFSFIGYSRSQQLLCRILKDDKVIVNDLEVFFNEASAEEFTTGWGGSHSHGASAKFSGTTSQGGNHSHSGSANINGNTSSAFAGNSSHSHNVFANGSVSINSGGGHSHSIDTSANVTVNADNGHVHTIKGVNLNRNAGTISVSRHDSSEIDGMYYFQVRVATGSRANLSQRYIHAITMRR